MPIISDNYSNILTCNGNGDLDKDELKKLKILVQYIYNQNKKLRLWASPDHAFIGVFIRQRRRFN